MPQIVPIKELKDTSNISDLCHRSNEPIFITKNGYGDMVIMSMEHYEATLKRWAMYSEILQAEEQIKQGKTKDAYEALGLMRAKYGV